MNSDRIAAKNAIDQAAKKGRWQGRLSISFTLATAFGTLVTVAVLVVLILGLWSAQRNTRALLGQNVQIAMDSAASAIETHLKAAEEQTRYIRQLIESGRVDPRDDKAFGNVLIGALAATPQIEAIIYFEGPTTAFRVVRLPKGPEIDKPDISKDPAYVIGRNEMSKRMAPYWGPLVWRKDPNATYLNMRQPVIRNGELAGTIIAAVSVRDLSRYLDRINNEGTGKLFLLYDRNYVLAHPVMAGGYPGRSAKRPVPPLRGFSDPILASIWEASERFDLDLISVEGTDGHVVRLFNQEYIFIYRKLSSFGDKPMLLGVYVRGDDVGDELRRLLRAAIAGLVVLLIALLCAIFVGRRIARPIKDLSAKAASISHLEIAKVDDLPGSVFRELNDQSRAFNAMLRGLRWFETYVPKRLVERLIDQGEAGSLPSVSRDLTIMFTDIVGYTSLAEGADAEKIAGLLNEHFALVAACIEAEGGTVDKFIGDSVMAFWGAPDKQKNRAQHACRAARAIAEAIEADNARRAEAGQPPILMRIGIHSGEVTVGNIGAPGRVNYTIVGDAVNVASRLEQEGKRYADAGGGATTILLSGDTKAHLEDSEFKLERVGSFPVRGRQAPVEIFRLG